MAQAVATGTRSCTSAIAPTLGGGYAAPGAAHVGARAAMPAPVQMSATGVPRVCRPAFGVLCLPRP